MSLLGEALRRLVAIPDILRAFRRGSEKIDGIEVYGREEFRRAIRKAVLLLRDKKLPAWDTLTQHVGSIIEGSRTDAVVTAHPAFLFVSESDAAAKEAEFLAGKISFMACSIQLHRTYQSAFPHHRVPQQVYSSGRAALERCEKASHECLVALGKEGDLKDS
jgi:hypothetical protein